MLATDKEGNEYIVQKKSKQYFTKQIFVRWPLVMEMYETKGVNVKLLNRFLRSMDKNNMVAASVKELAVMAGVSLPVAKGTIKALVDKFFIRKHHSSSYQLNPAIKFYTNGIAREVAYRFFNGLGVEAEFVMKSIKADDE